MRFIQKAVLLVVTFLLVACASTSKTPPKFEETLAIPDTTQVLSSTDLTIRPLDMVKVTVFGVDELSDEYQVDYEGRLKMPLIGEVSAKGLNAYEMAEKLESMLGERYLQDPEVMVVVKSANNERITVDGSVKKPGLYPLRGNTTLLQAVALAGGPDELAATDRVIILRNIKGKRMAAGYSLAEIRKGASEDPKIYGNDIVVVDGSSAKRSYRELLRSMPLLGLFLAL